MILMPNDVFNVINRTVLYEEDRRILYMLYQPIIGGEAINLYFTLVSFLDRREVISSGLTHHDIMKSTQFNIEKIKSSREILEAIGLLKTYVKESDTVNSYIYEIYSPLKACEFFKDSLMATLLRDAVGLKEYKRIKEYFKVASIDLKDYKNITTTFKSAFKTVDLVSDYDIESLREETRLGISYTPTIDLDNVLGMIPDELLNKNISKDIKDLIYKLALVYNYDDEKIKNLIESSIVDKKIDTTKIKENARKLYRFETNNSKVTLLYKNQPEYLKTKMSSVSSKNKMIYRFETESPYDFLASKDGCELSKEETEILKMLLIDIGLTPGVTNVLLDYVLKTSENKLVKSYIESKALEWKRCKIETVPDAMEKAKEEKKKKVVKKDVPSWIDKNLEMDELSEEEEKAFRQRLKDME